MNNDRFKFRAWDKKCNIMHTSGLSIHDGKLIRKGYQWFSEHADWPECILIQSTGLKDKNGKLIMESDIVKFLFSEWEESRTRIIKWDQDFARFTTTQEDDEEGEYLGWVTHSEIIGNIYQDSHLLEGEQSEKS